MRFRPSRVEDCRSMAGGTCGSDSQEKSLAQNLFDYGTPERLKRGLIERSCMKGASFDALELDLA